MGPGLAALLLSLSALPAPPERVELKARSYGTVTLEHALHLSRRASCKECHGPGRVEKIEFTARLAHERCRTCHVELARGPTRCRECHVRSDPGGSPELGVTALAPPPASPAEERESRSAIAESASARDATREAAAAVPIAVARIDASPAPAVVRPMPSPRATGTRTLRAAHAGLTVLAGDQGAAAGTTLGVRSQTRVLLLGYDLTLAGGGGATRWYALVGAGTSFSPWPSFTATTMLVGGLDKALRPFAVLPAVGLQGSLEWSGLGARPGTLGLSLTALSDVVRPRLGGQRAGGTTVALSARFGHALGAANGTE